MIRRSAEELERSRSCQRATDSIAVIALARMTRASPQTRSESSGLRLWGIAEEPACPPANGLFDLADLGPLEGPDLDGELFERSGD